jgi:sensor histidine kinase YesM
MDTSALDLRRGPWRYRSLRHLAYWALPFLGFLILLRIFATTRTAWEVALTVFIPAPLTAYLHFYVLKRFFETRRYWIYAVLVVAIVAFSSVLTAQVHGRLVHDETSRISGLGVAILVILLSTGIHYFSRGLRQQYRVQEAEARQLQAELALLRAQLHPHFLFNTLNGLYALALDRSELMPDVVLKLSRLLRYSLDSGDRSRVPLPEEIRFLETYVELERLRLDRGADLSLEIRGAAGGHEVAPMLLAPLVENAFRHGNLGLDTDAFVRIRLDIEDDLWCFTAINSVAGRASSGRSGMGLVNVRRRLELLYPGRHRLDVRAGRDRFQAILEVRS